MRVEPFDMERLQSTYENEVEFNLSESGVHPLRLGELVHDSGSREALLGRKRFDTRRPTARPRCAR